MEEYVFFSVTVFNEKDQLYLNKTFNIFEDAVEFALSLIDKYSSTDEIGIFVYRANKLWSKKGSKVR